MNIWHLTYEFFRDGLSVLGVASILVGAVGLTMGTRGMGRPVSGWLSWCAQGMTCALGGLLAYALVPIALDMVRFTPTPGHVRYLALYFAPVGFCVGALAAALYPVRAFEQVRTRLPSARLAYVHPLGGGLDKPQSSPSVPLPRWSSPQSEHTTPSRWRRLVTGFALAWAIFLMFSLFGNHVSLGWLVLALGRATATACVGAALFALSPAIGAYLSHPDGHDRRAASSALIALGLVAFCACATGVFLFHLRADLL